MNDKDFHHASSCSGCSFQSIPILSRDATQTSELVSIYLRPLAFELVVGGPTNTQPIKINLHTLRVRDL